MTSGQRRLSAAATAAIVAGSFRRMRRHQHHSAGRGRHRYRLPGRGRRAERAGQDRRLQHGRPVHPGRGRALRRGATRREGHGRHLRHRRRLREVLRRRDRHLRRLAADQADEEVAGLQEERHQVRRGPGRQRRHRRRDQQGQRLVDCLTTDQLKKIWEPGLEGQRASKRDRPEAARRAADAVTARAPTPARSTSSPTRSTARRARPARTTARPRTTTSLVQGVAGDKGGLGYFGFSYYEENAGQAQAWSRRRRRRLRRRRATETIQDGTYTPLARPLFMYPNDEGARSSPRSRRSWTTGRQLPGDRRGRADRADDRRAGRQGQAELDERG